MNNKVFYLFIACILFLINIFSSDKTIASVYYSVILLMLFIGIEK